MTVAALAFPLIISLSHAKLHPPSDRKLAELSGRFERFNEAVDTLKADSDRLDALKRKAGYFQSGRYDLSRLSAEELAELTEKSQSVVQQRRGLNDWAADLMRETQLAYGISDPDYPISGTIRSGPPNRPGVPNAMESFLGQTASFRPRFDPTLPRGKLAHTGHDGAVRVGLGAFKYPGKLAQALYHEQEHVRDLLAPNRDLRNDAAVELRIRSAQRETVARIFALRPDDMRLYDAFLARLPEAKTRWDEQIQAGFDPYRIDHWQQVFYPILSRRGIDFNPGGFNLNESLEEIHRGADELAAAVDQQREERREAERQDEARRAQERREAADEGYRVLIHWVAEACGIEGWEANLDHPTSLKWLAWRDAHFRAVIGRRPEFPIAIDPRAGGCDKRLLDEVVARANGPNPDPDSDRLSEHFWVAGRIRASRPPRTAPIRSNPLPVVAPPPVVPPPSVPDPDDGRPSPPSTPHCRYHDWCKDPEKR